MQQTACNTFFDATLADEIICPDAISTDAAEKLFSFFKSCSLFRWTDANNDCEDRANAICILLDRWNMCNAKAWTFSGQFSGKSDGYLLNGWKYHVAATVPVSTNSGAEWYVIDPATSNKLQTAEEWALNITLQGNSYYFVKNSHWYIFPSCRITKHNWHTRDRRNFNWTMQGLTGFNGASIKGKAQLAFHKQQVKRTVDRFRKLINEPPQ